MELIIAMGSWLGQNYVIVLEIIGVFAILATLTPNKADDKVVQIVLDLINAFGMNTGKAKNSKVD